MAEKRALTIHFTDGTKFSFDFPKQVPDDQMIASRIEKVLKHQYLMVEADGTVLMFPLNNIKYIQAYPAPAKIPDNMIKGASIVDS